MTKAKCSVVDCDKEIEEGKLHIQCNRCAKAAHTRPKKEGAGPKLPPGWKYPHTDILCKQCIEDQFALRAPALRIQRPINGTWEDLYSDLKPLWRQTTQASNFISTELYVHDKKTHKITSDKLAPMEPSYLYPQITKRFTLLPGATAAYLEMTSTKTYNKRRYELLVGYSTALSSFKFPQPYPVRQDSWNIDLTGETPVLIVSLGSRRWELKLMGGARYRRQINQLKQLEMPGPCMLYRQRVDGQDVLMCRLIGRFARSGKSNAREDRTLYVRTTEDALLKAEVLSGETGKIGVYSISGPTGKKYHGQTINYESRVKQHKSYNLDDPELYYDENFRRDLQTHGWDAFTFELEETLSLDEVELLRIEESFAAGNSYNNQSELERLRSKEPGERRGHEDHRQVWTENGDHLRRVIKQQQWRNQRLSEDRKAEVRSSRTSGLYLASGRFSEKYDRRLKSGTDEIASHLVNFAIRYKNRRIVYDDTYQWSIGFRYFALRHRIKTLCTDASIEFVWANDPALKKTQGSLARGVCD